MGGGYQPPALGDLGELFAKLERMQAEIKEIGRPDASQTARALQTLTDLVNGLLDQVNGIFTGFVTAGGNISTPATVSATTMLNSVGAYNNDITATRRGAWWRSNGDAGYASSSMAKKELLEGDLPDPRAILEIADTYFHYKAELDKRDNPENPEYDPDYHVAMEWGTIAEWLHDLGLWQVVVYEDHWKPVAVHYELMGLLAIRAARFIWDEHLLERAERLALDRRVDALEILAGL